MLLSFLSLFLPNIAIVAIALIRFIAMLIAAVQVLLCELGLAESL